MRKTLKSGFKQVSSKLNNAQNAINRKKRLADRGTLDKAFFYDRLLLNPAFTTRLYNLKVNDDGTVADREYICSALVGTSAGYNISNNWGNSGGIVDTLIDSLGSLATSSTGKYLTEALAGIFGGGEYGKAAKTISNNAKVLANSHIFSKSKLIKQYQGTEVNPTGAEEITLHLLSDSEDADIRRTIANIRKLAMGDYWSVGDLFSEDETNPADKGAVVETLDSLVAIQKPPNNYSSDLTKGIKDGRVGQGTLELRIGKLFTFQNLVIKSMDVEFNTKSVMKLVNGEPKVVENIPYSAVVKLTFEYSRMITPIDLDKIFSISSKS